MKLLTTLQDVIDAKPPLIFYSTNTVWWTHDPEQLQKGPVPLDIFGSPLFQTQDTGNFLNVENIEKCEIYGYPRNRVRNFMYMHNANLTKLRAIHTHLPKQLMSSTSEFSLWLDKNIMEDNMMPKEAT